MTEIETFRTPKRAAPCCGKVLDAATGTDRPSPADVSVCFECGSLLVFNDDLTLRILTAPELAALDAGTLAFLMRTRARVIELRAERGGGNA